MTDPICLTDKGRCAVLETRIDRLIGLLNGAERFIAGFEDDPAQNVNALLRAIRRECGTTLPLASSTPLKGETAHD